MYHPNLDVETSCHVKAISCIDPQSALAALLRSFDERRATLLQSWQPGGRVVDQQPQEQDDDAPCEVGTQDGCCIQVGQGQCECPDGHGDYGRHREADRDVACTWSTALRPTVLAECSVAGLVCTLWRFR